MTIEHKRSSKAEIEDLIRARYSLIWVTSPEETRVEESLRKTCVEREMRLEVWSITEGFKVIANGQGTRDVKDPMKAIDHVLRAEGRALFVLRDFHPFLKEPAVVRKLRDAATELRKTKKSLIVLSPVTKIPPELEKSISAVLDWELPNRTEIEGAARKVLPNLPAATQQVIESDPTYMERVVEGALGLTLVEAENVFAKSAVRTPNPRGAKLLTSNKFYPTYQPLSSDFDTRGGMAQLNHTELSGAALTLSWIASPSWTLKSITAYRESSTDTNIDFDTLPAKVADVNAVYKDHQFSQELQANYDAGGSIHSVFGLYYFKGAANGEIHNIFLGSPPYSTLGFAQYGSTGGSMGTKSIAGYGDLTWDIDPQWSLDVGLRLTQEKKSAVIQNFAFADEAFTRRIATAADFSGAHTSRNASPKVSLAWNASEQVKLYATYSAAFHSGGYNIRANCVAIPQSCRPIKDEKVQSFEIGSKMSFFDGRLMMNTAAFHNIYSDIQLSVFTSYTLPNGAQGFFGDFTNAGKGHIDGLEEEFAWKPSDNWTVSGNVAYLHTKYTEFMSAGKNIADTQRFTNAPKWSGGLSVENNYPLANGGSIGARVNYTYQSTVYPETTLSPLIAQRGYGLWNAGIVWEVNEPWTLSLQGTNLANKSYRTTGYNIAALGIVTGFYGAPRMVTLTARYKF